VLAHRDQLVVEVPPLAHGQAPLETVVIPADTTPPPARDGRRLDHAVRGLMAPFADPPDWYVRSLFPQVDALVAFGVEPRFESAGAYGPNGERVRAHLERAKGLPPPELERVGSAWGRGNRDREAFRCDERAVRSGIATAARRTGRDAAVRQAYLDGQAAILWAWNPALPVLEHWETTYPEVPAMESAGYAAAALAVGDALHGDVTDLALRPWRAHREEHQPGGGGPASNASGGGRPWWVVVSSGEPSHPFDGHAPLAPGTVVEEVRRFERWDHQGCVESSFFVVAEMRVVGGPRAGEVVEVFLGAGWEHEFDASAAAPEWLSAPSRESGSMTQIDTPGDAR